MEIKLNNITFDELRNLRDQLIKLTDATALNLNNYAQKVEKRAFEIEYKVPTLSLFVGNEILNENTITIDFNKL